MSQDQAPAPLSPQEEYDALLVEAQLGMLTPAGFRRCEELLAQGVSTENVWPVE
jgi:hypothetical protein